ncbi:MAG: hypothetical protein GY874_23220 [Desulfobacteraceae bacterium]|nr:hypothetical protein [Desulfobacteraceae bacterium]
MKYKLIFMVMGFITIMGFTAPAYPEFYRYVDKHGNTMFTDDISNVPVGQRAKVKAYEESPTSLTSDTEKTQEEQKQSAASQTSGFKDKEAERQRLESQKKALTLEKDALMAERIKLDEEKNQVITRTQIKAYNEKIIKLNKRIETFEEKLKAHNAQIEAFEKSIKSQ